MVQVTMDTHNGPAFARFDVRGHQLVDPATITSISVFDFDNTLFSSPCPDPHLFTPSTLTLLASHDVLVCGGWWQDPRFLGAIGDGVDKEEVRAWKGFWKENVVKMARLAIQDPTCLAVCLTGRNREAFGNLITRMCKAKGLNFDIICLRSIALVKNHQDTRDFKIKFMEEMLTFYSNAKRIDVFDDRTKHVLYFRKTLSEFAQHLQGRQVQVSVFDVAPTIRFLDPMVEKNLVQKVLDEHNAVKWRDYNYDPKYKPISLARQVLFTGYLLPIASSNRLLKTYPVPPQTEQVATAQIKYTADCIPICTGQAPPSLLEQLGGTGTKVTFQVTRFGFLPNKIWAVEIKPVDENANIKSLLHPLCLVLAVRKNTPIDEVSTITNWTDENIEPMTFTTTLGEFALLRLEGTGIGQGARFGSNKNQKRNFRQKNRSNKNQRFAQKF